MLEEGTAYEGVPMGVEPQPMHQQAGSASGPGREPELRREQACLAEADSLAQCPGHSACDLSTM